GGTAGDEFGHRTSADRRHAEVAGGHPCQVTEVALPQRLVEAEPRHHLGLELGRDRRVADEGVQRAARCHLEEKEQNGDDDEQEHQRRRQKFRVMRGYCLHVSAPSSEISSSKPQRTARRSRTALPPSSATLRCDTQRKVPALQRVIPWHGKFSSTILCATRDPPAAG